MCFHIIPSEAQHVGDHESDDESEPDIPRLRSNTMLQLTKDQSNIRLVSTRKKNPLFFSKIKKKQQEADDQPPDNSQPDDEADDDKEGEYANVADQPGLLEPEPRAPSPPPEAITILPERIPSPEAAPLAETQLPHAVSKRIMKRKQSIFRTKRRNPIASPDAANPPW